MSILSSIFGLKTHNSKAIAKMNSSEFKTLTEGKNVQLIDVRTPHEFNSGHLPKAKNIDFFSGKSSSEFAKLNQDLPVYVYCKSGIRSGQTARKLAKMGFKEIYDLQGGILNYNF